MASATPPWCNGQHGALSRRKSEFDPRWGYSDRTFWVRFGAGSVRRVCEHAFVKPEQKAQARALREQDGLSLRDIAERLGVSKASVSLWVRDIELTAEQQAALLSQNPARNGQLLGMRVRRERCRARRVAAQQHGRALARQGDPDHIAGCMLYWAEGSKARNAAQLVNADPDLLTTFLAFLRSSYDVPDERVALSVNCFLGNGLSLDEIQRWWLVRLGLPSGCLRKAVVNRPSAASNGRKGHVLPYGTARLTVHSTFIVQSIYGAIQEYAGIDRPEWLDL
jgi:AcrR family transcriptional regulator